ncbi:MAG: hypothetical protein POG74_11080 [Acidocella sp.]|nr:hypothetical protein [Acidocella sp.]
MSKRAQPGPASHHVNFGTLALRVPEGAPDHANGMMTVVVSGVGRSGTSAVAKVLHALGVPMGNTNNLAVYEDQDFLHALLFFDQARIAELIVERNNKYPRWGFKFPSLQNHLLPPQLSRFRAPHLILVMRDPVATASRAFSSDTDGNSIIDTFLNVTRQTFDLVNFMQKVECPTLLISYEKLLAFPDQTIDSIVAFCGIELDTETRIKARQAIEPNNPQYIELFHNPYRGHFDAIEGGYALGWGAATFHGDPISVELLADGVVKASARADIFRQDLLDAGIGEGCHSFKIPLARLKIKKSAKLSVRVAGDEFMLEGSGRTLNK